MNFFTITLFDWIMDYKREYFLDHNLEHHLDCLGKWGLPWIDSITTPDTRQSFGVHINFTCFACKKSKDSCLVSIFQPHEAFLGYFLSSGYSFFHMDVFKFNFSLSADIGKYLKRRISNQSNYFEPVRYYPFLYQINFARR